MPFPVFPSQWDQATCEFHFRQNPCRNRPSLQNRTWWWHAGGLQHRYFTEAIEQYNKAFVISSKKADFAVRLAEAYVQAGQKDKAVKELKTLLQSDSKLIIPRLKLGLILYNSHHIAEAVDQWENVLRYEPKNTEALRYLKMAQAAGVTILTN